METFRLLNDEKASKAMINLEKKITGYSSMSRTNQPNPNYINPENGDSRDERKKKKLLYRPCSCAKVYAVLYARDLQETARTNS